MEFGDLQAVADACIRQEHQALGVCLQRIVRIRRENASGEHVEAGEGQSFRAPDAASRRGIAVTPLWSRSGIEQDADDGEIKRGARARSGIAPVRFLVDHGPAIVAIEDKVTPTRVEWHDERRIIMTRRVDDEVDRLVEMPKIDLEVRQLIVEADRQHPLRAFADRLGAQKRKRSGRIGFHARKSGSQYFSSERPTESVRSCGLGGSGV